MTDKYFNRNRAEEIELSYAICLAVKAHQRQLDKNGKPFILHPLAVMLNMSTHDERLVAILHDVLEDTKVTKKDLIYCFLKKISEAVDAITRRKNETYRNYIQRVKKNPLARAVKIKDLQHNMSPERHCQDSESLRPRYEQALKSLQEEL